MERNMVFTIQYIRITKNTLHKFKMMVLKAFKNRFNTSINSFFKKRISLRNQKPLGMLGSCLSEAQQGVTLNKLCFLYPFDKDFQEQAGRILNGLCKSSQNTKDRFLTCALKKKREKV